MTTSVLHSATQSVSVTILVAVSVSNSQQLKTSIMNAALCGHVWIEICEVVIWQKTEQPPSSRLSLSSAVKGTWQTEGG
jgi:hypothetical protein